MSKAKAIEFRLMLSGQGIVQYNGNDNAMLNAACRNNRSGNKGRDSKGNIAENGIYAKYNYRMLGTETRKTNDEQEYEANIIERQLKISADGLRHAIHIVEHPISMYAPLLKDSQEARIRYIANLGTIERGYLIADRVTIKRTSAYTITDARETGEALPTLETCATSGLKDSTSNSLFYRDQVGDTKYEAIGYINLAELGFISMSIMHDRVALHEGDEKLFREQLAKNLKSAHARLAQKGYNLPTLEENVPEPTYYLKAAENEESQALWVAEKGILLHPSQTAVLAYDLLDKMTMIYISKSQSGYARTEKLEVRCISNPLNDLPSGDGFEEFGKGFALNEIEQGYVFVPDGAARVKACEDAMEGAKVNKKDKQEKKEQAKAKRGKK